MPIPSTPPYVKVTNIQFIKSPDTVSVNRRPSYLDTFQYTKNRIYVNKGSSSFHFRDTNWPKFGRLNFEIPWIDQATAVAVESFIKTHVGEVITLVINNITYTGVIVNPSIAVVDEKGNECSYTIAFSFETQNDI